jgi:hypothetical protein
MKGEESDGNENPSHAAWIWGTRDDGGGNRNRDEFTFFLTVGR